jgi:hypothetical protein
MPVAQFRLSQRSALIVGVADECGRANLTFMHGTARGVGAREQLALGGHGLFFLQAQVVGGDALVFHQNLFLYLRISCRTAKTVNVGASGAIARPLQVNLGFLVLF